MLTPFDLADLKPELAPGAPAFLGYSPDEEDLEIRARFTQRYGAPPEQILRSAGAVLAGPIPDRAEPARSIE